MRTFIAVMLCSALAWADPPGLPPCGKGNEGQCVGSFACFAVPDGFQWSTDSRCDVKPSDAPVADTAASVKLKAGEPAPFDARCVTEAENLRRGGEHADMRGELEKAHQSWLMPKSVFVLIVVGAAVLAAGAAAGLTYAADHKK